MSKFTPGPWKHEVHETDFRGTGVIWAQCPEWEPGMFTSPNNKIVAKVSHNSNGQTPWRGTEGEEFEANAALMAAAPCMFNELKAIAAYLDTFGLLDAEEPEYQIRESIRALLCKASGKQEGGE